MTPHSQFSVLSAASPSFISAVSCIAAQLPSTPHSKNICSYMYGTYIFWHLHNKAKCKQSIYRFKQEQVITTRRIDIQYINVSKKSTSTMLCDYYYHHTFICVCLACCPVWSRKKKWRLPKPRIFWRATPILLMTHIPRPCLHTPWLCYAALMPRWPCAASTTWPSHKVVSYSSLRATRSVSHWKFFHSELSNRDNRCFTR